MFRKAHSQTRRSNRSQQTHQRRRFRLLSMAIIAALVLLFLPLNAAFVLHLGLRQAQPHGEAGPATLAPSPSQAIDLAFPFGVMPIRATGGLTITKVANPSPVGQGTLLNYTVIFTNQTGVDLENVTVTDTVPANTACVAIFSSIEWFTSLAGCQAGEARWRMYTFFGDVLPQGSTTALTYTVRVDQPLPDGFELVNPAGTYGISADRVGGGPTVSDMGARTVTTTVQSPLWQIGKTAFPTDTVQAGQLITYTITATNNGSYETNGNYLITDVIPINTAFFTSTPVFPDNISGGVITWTITTTLQPTESTDLLWSVRVSQPLTPGTIITNAVYGVSGGGVLTPVVSTAPVTVSVSSGPILTVSKVFSTGQGTVGPGDFITYTVTYENIGNNIATGVVVSDTIPANTTLQGSNPPFDSANAPEYGWLTPSLTINDPQSIQLWVQVNPSLPDGTLLTNTVTITSQEGTGDSDTATSLVNSSPVLSFSKSDSPDPVLAGGTLIYTLTVTNTGTTTATTVMVTDTLDANTTYLAANPTPVGEPCSICQFNLGPIAVGISNTITVAVTVDPTTPHATTLTNFATISAVETTTLTISETTTVQAPIFDISKSVTLPPPAPYLKAGQTVTYTIYYTNSSPIAATSIRITDTLPISVTGITSDTGSASVIEGTPPTLVFGLASLVNGSGAITIVGQAINTPWSTQLLDLTNTVSATIDVNPTLFTDDAIIQGGPDDPANAVLTATPLVTPISGASTVTATLTDQFGNAVLDGLSITFSTTLGGSSIGPANTSNGQAVSSLTSTAPGTTTVQVSNPGVAGNSQVITFTAAVLEINKTVSTTLAFPGDTLLYTIFITNTGDATATGVMVNDPLPPDVTFVASNPPGGPPFNLSDIAPLGGTATVEITVTVNLTVQDGAQLVNQATVNAAEATNMPSSTVTTTVQASRFKISKGVTPQAAVAGEVVTFTITFTSDGTVPVTGLRITDTLPLSLTNINVVSDTPALVQEPAVFPNVVFSMPSPYSGTGVITITGQLATTPWPSTPLALTNYVTGTININPTVFNDQATVSGSSGPPVTITLVATPTTIGIPGPIALTASMVDLYGNPIVDGQTVIFTSTLGGSSFTPSNAVPSSGGQANVNLTSGSGGQSTVTAGIGGITATTVVTFTAPGIGVSKTADRTQVSPGGTIVYTIIVSNTGDTTLSNVSLTDVLVSSELQFVSASPAPTGGSGQIWDFSLPPLGIGQAHTVSLTASVVSNALIGIFLDNTAVVSATEVTGTEQDTAQVETVRAAVDVLKSVSPPVVLAGQMLTYTIAYTNNNAVSVTNLLLSDLLPAQVTSVTVTSGGATLIDATPPSLVFSRATLAASASDQITIVGQVITAPWPANGLTMTNVVSTTSDQDALGMSAQSSNEGWPNAPATLLISASPVSTTIANTVMVTATVQDQYGNPVYDGTSVTFNSSLAGTIINPAPTVNGVAVTTLSSTEVGTTTVTASAGFANDSVMVRFTEVPIQYVYLPLLMKDYTTPMDVDLVVDLIEISSLSPAVDEPLAITVTIRNSGLSSTPTRFWVDLYIATQPITPQVNQTWSDLTPLGVPFGVAWVVPGLGGGQTMTLSNLIPNNPADCENYSNFTPPLVGGCNWPANRNSFSSGQEGTYFITAQVDSFGESAPFTFGNIVETDETNNVYTGTLTINVSSVTGSRTEEPAQPNYESSKPGASRRPLTPAGQ